MHSIRPLRLRPLCATLLLGTLSAPNFAGVPADGETPALETAPSRWSLITPPRLGPQTEGTPRFESGDRLGPHPVADYPAFFELSLGDNVAELGFRQDNPARNGYFGASILANEDDDYAVMAQLVREGPMPDQPARIGVGAAAYAIRLDQPRENVFAIAILGTAEYDLESQIPVTLSGQIAYAPSITTFDDGDSLKDLRFQALAEISDSAAVFLGIRILEANTTRDHRIDEGIHLGIRLAL